MTNHGKSIATAIVTEAQIIIPKKIQREGRSGMKLSSTNKGMMFYSMDKIGQSLLQHYSGQV